MPVDIQRVRHSPFATNREFTDAEEMICTMRICPPLARPARLHLGVKKSRSFGSPTLDRSKLLDASHQHSGPELVLTAIHNSALNACCSGELGSPIQLSERFISFGSSSSPLAESNNDKRKRRTIGDVTIPIGDIMVVDMYGANDSHRANITTMSHGYFEFTLESRNGQEVLLAFLKANLPKDRVMDGNLPRSPSQISQSTRSSASKSFDVEAFTARRMAERVENETFGEKLQRRLGKVVSSLEDRK